MNNIELFGFLIFLLPLIAFPITLLAGKLKKGLAGIIATASIFLSFLLAMFIFITDAHNIQVSPVYVSFKWFYNFTFGIYLDSLALVMVLMVSGVSFLIHLFAIEYLGRDPARHVYFSETALFTAGMLGLILTSNMLLYFIFWEIVGVCSYLLIGFWWYKPNAAAAAKKAFIVTRVGDVLFLFGIAVLYYSMVNIGITDPLSIPVFLQNISKISSQNLTLIGLLFLGGAMGKSAQFPLHVWIPDAMEGPATVSALIHAATMVTAGIYLVARVFPIYLNSNVAITAVLFVGAFTAFYAGTLGLVVNDLKRVLAYSTISQLGYMLAALGTGLLIGQAAISASIYQLIVHSFLKALLFLSAGAILFALLDTRDIRKMGGLWRKMPITITMMFIGALTLVGFPLTAGFFSKDEIISLSYALYQSNGNIWPWLLLVVGAFLTTLYTFRMFFLVALGKPKTYAAEHAKDPPWVMIIPLIALAALSLVFGIWQNPFYAYVESVPTVNINVWIEYTPTILMFAGIGIAYLFYGNRRLDSAIVAAGSGPLYKLVKSKYYLDYIFTNLIAERIVVFVSMITYLFDKYVVDGIVNGSAKLVYFSGRVLRRLQTGVVQNYTALLIIGAILLLIILRIWGVWL